MSVQQGLVKHFLAVVFSGNNLGLTCELGNSVLFRPTLSGIVLSCCRALVGGFLFQSATYSCLGAFFQ